MKKRKWSIFGNSWQAKKYWRIIRWKNYFSQKYRRVYKKHTRIF